MATKKSAAPDPLHAAFDTMQAQSRQAGEAVIDSMQQLADLGFYFRARMGTAATAVIHKHQELASQEQATFLDALDQFASQARLMQERMAKAMGMPQA